MKLSLIHEADMNRRDFLKLLGKAGAAAYGTPLGKAAEAIGGLASSVSPKSVSRIVMSIPNVVSYGAHGGGSGEVPTLSRCLLGVRGSWGELADLLGMTNFVKSSAQVREIKTKEVGSYLDNSDSEWGFGAEIDETDLKKLAADAGTNIDDDWFWHDRFGIVITKPGDHTLGKIISDPVQQWVASSKFKLSDLIQNEEDVWEFEQADLDEVTPRDEVGKVESVIKRIRDRSQSREVGYERQGQYDPQSSRPAQALGPFESRLREVFKILTN